jgi:hypothetical protein
VNFKATGRLEINNGLRINLGLDFIRYYKWLIEKAYWNTQRLQLPAHLAHCTLINPKIHKNFNYAPALPFIGKDIEFTYNPTTIYESKVNFWLPIQCPLAEEIKNKCGVYEGKNYYGLHITLANRKFNDN